MSLLFEKDCSKTDDCDLRLNLTYVSVYLSFPSLSPLCITEETLAAYEV